MSLMPNPAKALTSNSFFYADISPQLGLIENICAVDTELLNAETDGSSWYP